MKGTEPRDERLTVRLPASLLTAIEAAAKRDRRSVADWVVWTLTDVVTKKGK